MKVPTLLRAAYIRLLITLDLLHAEEGVLGKAAVLALGLLPKDWQENLAFGITSPTLQADPKAPTDIPSSGGSYVTTQRPTISNTDVHTQKDEFHQVIKTTPGADQ
jgi:hypothetical protein